jgi:putative intracellular protease/amidase
MVQTSHDVLGHTGRKTGFWLEEFAAPYFVFCDAGVQLTLASPKGGQPPVDPVSDLPESQTPAMSRFKQDLTAPKTLSQTVKLVEVKSEDYDTVFICGRARSFLGPRRKRRFHRFTRVALQFRQADRSRLPFAGLRHVTYQGAPLVKGKRVTGFTNGEGEAVHLTQVVPFLVEDELTRLGASFEKPPNWQPFSIVDGRLITGQNPASSTVAAENLVNLLVAEKAPRCLLQSTPSSSRPRDRLAPGICYAV